MGTPVSRSSARKRNNDESILVVTNIHLSSHTRAAKNSDGQGPEVCRSRKAAGHFQTVTNSDLRLRTSDSEHEHGQERCIRASSFLRHSSFVLRHSSVLYCCVRAAESSHRRGREVCPSQHPAIRVKHPRFHLIATLIILTSYFVLSKIRAYGVTAEFFDRGLAASAERQ